MWEIARQGFRIFFYLVMLVVMSYFAVACPSLDSSYPTSINYPTYALSDERNFTDKKTKLI